MQGHRSEQLPAAEPGASAKTRLTKRMAIGCLRFFV
jgi:hypothetical protein